MTTQTEALKLALEALLDTQRYGYFVQHSSLPQQISDAIIAIKEALAQPEQEPVDSIEQARKGCGNCAYQYCSYPDCVKGETK